MRVIIALLLGLTTLAWADPADDLKACQAQGAATAQRLGEIQRNLDRTAALANFYAVKYAEAQSALDRLMETRPTPPVSPTPKP